MPGGTVTERWIPVDRVGLYVPGGRAVYPSSVVMNVVPAQEAGVESIAVTSPAQKDAPGFAGLPHPTILAACALLGVDEVYAVGGAQAIAMFAYGARDTDGSLVCEPADLVTGPGNIWVAAAKRLLKGVIGIDAEAGPTEIMVLADETADAGHRRRRPDQPGRARPDGRRRPGHRLTSRSSPTVETRAGARRSRPPSTRSGWRTALAGPQSAIVLVDDLDSALARRRRLRRRAPGGPDPRTPRAVAARVRNAGAIFVGPWAPVSLGDYAAGSNHVLPTGGCACHSSGLSVQSFLRGVHVVDYDEAALRDVAHHVVALANAEDLPAHGQAVQARFPDDVIAPPRADETATDETATAER